jgi:hypothetical protein
MEKWHALKYLVSYMIVGEHLGERKGQQHPESPVAVLCT